MDLFSEGSEFDPRLDVCVYVCVHARVCRFHTQTTGSVTSTMTNMTFLPWFRDHVKMKVLC